MTFHILRYTPGKDAKPHITAYQVPVKLGMTVLDGLHYIKENLDPSLAWRSSCRMGVCGSCGMLVNGLPRLACNTQILEIADTRVVLGPLPNFDIIRDLVPDLTPMFDKHLEVSPFIQSEDEADINNPEGECYQSPEDLERYLRYLGRLSIYTRTRMDYEQSISQLTPEQEQIVASVNPQKSLLIRGGAGTGKSLVLIEALRQFEGSIVFISHDRHLINAIGTKVIEVQSGRLTQYLGDWEYYQWKKTQDESAPDTPSAPGPAKGSPVGRAQGASPAAGPVRTVELAYKERKELGSRHRKVERRIMEAEERQKELAATMSDSSHASDYELLSGASSEASALAGELAALYEEWGQLGETLGSTVD